MLIDLGGFSVGVRGRAESLPCRHTFTDIKVEAGSCNKCITERDESFRLGVFERRDELYQAVIKNDRLDQWPLPHAIDHLFTS